MACELPVASGVPLSRWSSSELAREAIGRGIVEQISGVTVWRWLSQDAIKPWQHRSWIFPRDPLFAQRAGPILDLYAGHWQGERLHPGDYVVCADEKPSIQALRRKHATLPATTGDGRRSSTSTSAWARCAIWPPGTPGARGSLTAARPRTPSSPSGSSSSSSCPPSPTPRPSAL
jgi:hypothetical protein